MHLLEAIMVGISILKINDLVLCRSESKYGQSFYAPKGWHIVITLSILSIHFCLSFFVKLAFSQVLQKTIKQLHNIIGFIKYLIPVGFGVKGQGCCGLKCKNQLYMITRVPFYPHSSNFIGRLVKVRR